MAKQLAAYIAANGNALTVNSKTLIVTSIEPAFGAAEITEFRASSNATYVGMYCADAQFRGDGEVWAVMSAPGREVVRFAVCDGKVFTLADRAPAKQKLGASN